MIKLIIAHKSDPKGIIIESKDYDDSVKLVSYLANSAKWYKDVLVRLEDILDTISFQEHEVNLNLIDDNYKVSYGKDFNVFIAVYEPFITIWKDRWGQKEEDLCAALEMENGDGAYEVILSTGHYFFDKEDEVWYCKNNSMFEKLDEYLSEFIESGREEFNEE